METIWFGFKIGIGIVLALLVVGFIGLIIRIIIAGIFEAD